jgi:large subunit ribosomal protein L13e
LRPAVRGQTNRYNAKIKLGRGFTTQELRLAGVTSLAEARSIGIAVDLRRKDTCNETLNMNSNRVKTYLSKIVVHRANKKGSKNVPSKLYKEVNFNEANTDPAVKVQNLTKEVIRKLKILSFFFLLIFFCLLIFFYL